MSGSHRQKFFGESLASDVPSENVFEQIREKFTSNVFLLHLPYGSGDADRRILSQWRALLGENVINLTDPTLVIEVMLGIIAMTMNSRDMDTFLDDFRTLYQVDRLKSAVVDPDDTEDKVRTMRTILGPYSSSVTALTRVSVQGALPAKSDRARFEAQFHGQPCALLGQVSQDETFVINLAGSNLVETRIEDLAAAWTRRFGSLI